MPLRSRIIIVVGGGVVLILLILAVAYPLFLGSDEEEFPVADTIEIQSPSEIEALPSDDSVEPRSRSITSQDITEPVEPTITDEQSQRAEIERISRTFIERFGSYSNYSTFETIDALDSLLTLSMRTYVDSVVEDHMLNRSLSEYFGVSTKLLSFRLDRFVLSGSATANITIQQEEQRGLDGEIQKTVRDGRVELVYSNGKWLINGLFYNN